MADEMRKRTCPIIIFSIGIVGVAIWKNKEGGERFWLLLIFWQFFLSLIQIYSNKLLSYRRT